eukprot:COSAG05_NODE_1748_length_4150_cov_2.073068_2_plen_713_part_00
MAEESGVNSPGGMRRAKTVLAALNDHLEEKKTPPPASHYGHKLKSVFMDVAILQLMPMMLKSTQFMHCRDDTPDGKSRVVSMPLLECAGVHYNVVWVVALTCFVGAGFCFPLFVIWSLHLRASAPTVEVKSHTLFVGDIEAQHGDTMERGRAKADLQKLKAVIIRFMKVAHSRGILLVRNGSSASPTEDYNIGVPISEVMPPEPPGEQELQAEHMLWLVLTQHHMQHELIRLSDEHILSDNFDLRHELCQAPFPGEPWGFKDKDCQLKLLSLGLEALLTLIVVDEFQKTAEELELAGSKGEHTSDGSWGVLSVQLSLRIARPSWAIVTFKTQTNATAIMSVGAAESRERSRLESRRDYYMERHGKLLENHTKNQGTGKPLLLTFFSKSRARRGQIPIDKEHAAGKPGGAYHQFESGETRQRVFGMWYQSQRRLEVASMRRHVASLANTQDVAVEYSDVRGPGRGGRLLLSEYWATKADGSSSRRDWLSILYAQVQERCWWWTGAMLFRRTAVALFSSRRDGNRFEMFGTSSDWRTMVVLVLVVNVYLSSVFLPFEKRRTNYYSDLSLLILIVLYVLWISQEENFFTAVFFLALLVLVPLMVYLIVLEGRKSAKAKKNVDKLRDNRKNIISMAKRSNATSADAIFELARDRVETTADRDIDGDGNIGGVDMLLLNKAVHSSTEQANAAAAAALVGPTPPGELCLTTGAFEDNP